MLDLDAGIKQQIFERRILRRFFHEERDAPLPTQPEVVILGGQPGSGKTGILDTTTRAIERAGATWVINGDDYAVYFPGYRQLQKEHGAEAADMVRGVTSDWIKRTLDAAQARGVNVVLESTMRQPEVVRRTLEDFRGHGYQTHAKALAVNPVLSWQGNHVRREALALSGAPSRLATREVHDAGVRGCRETVAMIEREHLAARMTIVSRKGDVLYTNEQRGGRWTTQPRAVQTLEEMQKKPLTRAEGRLHDASWGAVLELASRRHVRDAVGSTVAASELAEIRQNRATDRAMMQLQSLQQPLVKPSSGRKQGGGRG